MCVCAQELGLPFIKLAATEVVSGVSGESEEILRDLFQQAKVSLTQHQVPRPCFLPDLFRFHSSGQAN